MNPTSIHPATTQDREAILALLSNADRARADGSAPWDDWETEGVGETYAALVDGQVVGAGNLSVLASRQGWLDLPPTHPSFRQLGIRMALASFLSERARKQELRVLRTAAGSWETRYHRSLGLLGFHRVSVSSIFVSDGLCQGAPPIERFDERQYSDVQNLLGRSPLLRTCAGLTCLDGRWLELTGKQCRELLASGSIWGVRSSRGNVNAFALESQVRQTGDLNPATGFALVDGNWQALGPLAMGIRGLSAGSTRVTVRLPDEPTVRGIFEAAGFQPETEGRETWLFELCLP